MTFRTICLTSVLALTASAAAAEMNFNRIAAFATPDNMGEGEDKARVTSAEIIYATEDGNTLVYTDSPLGVIGRIDITDPANPIFLGKLPTNTSSSSWRDIKTIGDFAYIVSEAGSHGMQIFDLTRLRTVSSPPASARRSAIFCAIPPEFQVLSASPPATSTGSSISSTRMRAAGTRSGLARRPASCGVRRRTTAPGMAYLANSSSMPR